MPNEFQFPTFDENMTLGEYFQQMQGGMPAPTNYQPPNETFQNLMSGFGGWNPTATAPAPAVSSTSTRVFRTSPPTVSSR